MKSRLPRQPRFAPFAGSGRLLSMKRRLFIFTLLLPLLLMSGCLVEEELPSAITPHFFSTATPLAEEEPATTETPAATAILPFLSDPIEVEITPTVQGVAGHACPYRLTGDFLALYATEKTIELSMGCPATKDEDTPIQTWPVTIQYQTFENGQVIRVSNRGWENRPLIYVLRKNQIYTRHDDTYNPNWRPTATPAYTEDNPDPFSPPVGLYQPTGSIGHLWRSNPDVFEDLGFATDTPIIMESQMLILDYGELIRLPALDLMFALKAGNPGTWTIYALPGEE